MKTRISILIILTLVLAALCVRAAQAESYLDRGLQLHQQSWAEPEVDLSNPIGGIELGSERDRYSIYVLYLSSISQHETGYGMTGLGARVRLTLDDLP